MFATIHERIGTRDTSSLPIDKEEYGPLRRMFAHVTLRHATLRHVARYVSFCDTDFYLLNRLDNLFSCVPFDLGHHSRADELPVSGVHQRSLPGLGNIRHGLGNIRHGLGNI